MVNIKVIYNKIKQWFKDLGKEEDIAERRIRMFELITFGEGEPNKFIDDLMTEKELMKEEKHCETNQKGVELK